MTIQITIDGEKAEDVLAQMTVLVAAYVASQGPRAASADAVVTGAAIVAVLGVPAAPSEDHFAGLEEPELPGMSPDQKPKRTRRTKAQIEADNKMAQADGPKAEPVVRRAEASAGQAAVPDNTASVPAASTPAAEGASAQAAVLGNDAGAAAPITADDYVTPDQFRAIIQVWASEADGRLPLVTAALAKLGVQKVKEVAAADYAGFLAELGVA